MLSRICLLLTLAVTIAGTASAACLTPLPWTDDAQRIQNELDQGRDAELCQDTTWLIKRTLVLTANGNRIYTSGLQGHSVHRATLSVASSSVATLVWGRGVANAELNSIRLDGGRGAYGFVARPPDYIDPFGLGSSGALVEFGGDASGQSIKWCEAFEPRGWSTLRIYEGSAAQCSGAYIHSNAVHDVGLPGGSSWADGITIACRDSTVDYNHVANATDGAIVIFGCPGSVFRENLIENTSRIGLGGINMVDPGPWNDSYSNVIVESNAISAIAEYGYPRLDVAIAMGPFVWGVCEGGFLRGATVRNNEISGTGIHYGFVADGVTDWVVTGNTDSRTYWWNAVINDCAGGNASPTGFLRHSTHASDVSCTFQQEFANGQAHGILAHN